MRSASRSARTRVALEYLKYMVDLLKQRGGAHIQVFGGGVIVPDAKPSAGLVKLENSKLTEKNAGKFRLS